MATARSCSTSGLRRTTDFSSSRMDLILLRVSSPMGERLAFGVRPSACASVTADPPTAARPSGVKPTSELRFMKSRTERPLEKRAVREVGSTWFGPAR